MPVAKTIKGIGHRAINAVWRIGLATRFFFLTLIYSGVSFRRFHLTIKELFSTGVMSLIIIIVAGLFVGMVLGLQGYETLKRYGSESALGVMVALGLVRELGPVVAALLFASRAGSAM
ncbi:MAG TPA: ABC transporter permease, partial [Gallionella sp.]|nr:ABC transporter permease [Gallionella sp.]